jgi:hypothetical protein
MENCVRGMMYENISLPPQGDSLMPLDNRWGNTALANRCVGNGLLITWYHRGTTNDLSNGLSPGTNNFSLINPIDSITGPTPCETPDTLPMMFSEEQIKLMTDSLVYPIYDEENQSYAKAYLYKLISEDSTLMNRGLPTDSMFQRFYENMQRSTIAQFYNIQDLITTDNFDTAIAHLFEIPDENLMDRNLSVTDSYLIYLLSDARNVLTANDSLVLDTIANQLAIEGGEGVYIARAILDIEVDDNISAPLFRIKASEKNDELIKSKLYPNPNNGTFTYEYKIGDSCCYEVSIINMQGQVMKVLNLANKSGSIEINSLSNNGIYFLVLRKESEIVDWKKIIACQCFSLYFL